MHCWVQYSLYLALEQNEGAVSWENLALSKTNSALFKMAYWLILVLYGVIDP